jgi:argonaute-like protein implicated in RNA metabolism and viral defense
VSSVKDGKPLPKDLMKAAATVKQMSATYNQSYRIVRDVLDSAIEVLVMDWPNNQYPYKYFTFISDRQKGLI